jgi:Tfp pilus assembly protein PilN
MNYEGKVNNLKESIQLYRNQFQKVKELQIEVDKKKNSIENLSKKSNSTVSFFLDKLGESIPKSILLKDIQFQPLLLKIKKDKKAIFDQNKMVISGTSSNGNEFTKWLQFLEAKPWVKSTSIIDYGIGKTTKTSFLIHLEL